MTEPRGDLPVEPDHLAAVLAAAKRYGGEWAEVYVERRDSETVKLEQGALSEIRTDRDLGVGIRVLRGDRAGFAYTNVLTLEAMLDAARAAVTGSGGGMQGPSPRIDLRERRLAPVQRATDPPDHVDPAVKVDLLRRMDMSAHGRGKAVTSVTAIHVDVTQDILVATSTGDVVRDRRVRTRVTCRATAALDGRRETGFDGPGVGAGMELYQTTPPERIGADAADRALRALDASPPPTGVLPVVLGSAGGGLLLHEACGHGLEGDGLSRKSSVYAATVGSLVGSPLVTAIDNPALSLEYGSYTVDDEGAPARQTVLLDSGIQVGALTDVASARILGGQPSANARRESYAHPPIPRMSNTYIAAGSEDPSAIVADVSHGVYVARLKGGDVNITTGEFAFAASEAYAIEQGQVTRPLGGLMLLGNGPAALASVEAVGDDLAFTQALCGKDEQWVPVSYGSPTLLLTGLTVSGGSRV